MPNGRTRLMLPLANFMPTLPGLAGLAGSLRAYAPSPCWRDSTTKPVKWQRMPKKIAVEAMAPARATSNGARAGPESRTVRSGATASPCCTR